MGSPLTQDTQRKATKRWQKFVLAVFSFMARRTQRMKRPAAMLFAERLGNFLYSLSRIAFKRPHRYARRNLRLTQFPKPDLTAKEQDAFIRRVFVHFAKCLVDFLRGPTLTMEELDRIVQAEGFEYAQAAMQAGKGTIIVTAHFGNWEMLGRWLSAKGFPLTVVAREPEDAAFAQYIQKMRENAGFSVLYRGSSVRELLSLLKSNKTIGLLPDQNSGDLFIPFFGIPAGTVAGPASLALRTGATLLPTYCIRLPDDTYTLRFLPPIDATPTGDKNADARRIMAEINRVLEGVIREYPDQWLWLHNRWKSAFDEWNRETAFPNGLPADVLQRWYGDTATN
jgi:Kdo2-lipid IVA lauroyltransferase/acyltransferase